MKTETITHLSDIFKPLNGNLFELSYDGVSICLIFETTKVIPDNYSYYFGFFTDEMKALEAANNHLTEEDSIWKPVYFVEIESGCAWPVELRACYGEEINF